MTRTSWQLSLVVFLIVVPMLAGCQLIQAPPKPTDASTADILRGPYEPQMAAAAPDQGDELYGWEKAAADAHAAKQAQLEGAAAIVSTADVLRAPYDAPTFVVVEPAQVALTELYGWEKVAADAHAAKQAQRPQELQPLIATADILRGPYGEVTLVQLPVTQAAVEASDELAGYVHADALATTAWLAAHLGDPNVRILDVRRPTGAADFAAAHIPNAQHVDLNVDLMDRDPNRVALDLIRPERFAELMGRLGIANDSTVVVYDAEGGAAAATLWWALHYYGHDDVRMLNGGLVKWLLEERDTTRAVARFAPTEFTVTVQPQWLATAQDVELALQDPSMFLVDARDYDLYVGARCISAAPRAGHIPGAVTMPARWQVTPDMKTLLPADRLAMSLALKGISPTQRGITYCGNGHLAAFDAFLLYVMGFEHVAVYDSSWLEWGVLPEAPAETGCPGCDAM